MKMFNYRMRYRKNENETFAFEFTTSEPIPEDILDLLLKYSSSHNKYIFIFDSETKFQNSIKAVNVFREKNSV